MYFILYIVDSNIVLEKKLVIGVKISNSNFNKNLPQLYKFCCYYVITRVSVSGWYRMMNPFTRVHRTLSEVFATIPEIRKGKNKSINKNDILFSAFAVFLHKASLSWNISA